MGEAPDNVWNIGAPGLFNIKNLDKIPVKQIEDFISVKIEYPAILINYHSVTTQTDYGIKDFENLLHVVSRKAKCIILTGANVDTGSAKINELMQSFADQNKNKTVLIQSFGIKRYLNLLCHVDIVIGNSSSGIIEAPFLGTPSVNIGPRQKGRLRAPSVIDCSGSVIEISDAIELALNDRHKKICSKRETPYSSNFSPYKAANIISNLDLINIRKPFVDISKDL